MRAGLLRSARSPCTRAFEAGHAVDPRRGGAPDDPGRRETPAREAHRATEAIWRIESARLIAGLTRIVGDIDTAEELAQDALVAALEQWPISGVPERPGAWLMGTGRHRAIDLVRPWSDLFPRHLTNQVLDGELIIVERVGH